MKVLFAATEAAPFVKTGGLGDVIGSLPAALAGPACDVRVVLPLYGTIDSAWRQAMKFIGFTYVQLGWRRQYCGIFSLTHKGTIYYFLDNEYYFKRKMVYGCFDDAERFAFFSKAVIDILRLVGFIPDVIHANDWQTALVPAYLRMLYSDDVKLSKIKTVFTIHNIQYQGQYSKDLLGDLFGIDPNHFLVRELEYGGDVNLMKGAVCLSDFVTTVSPTYAEEIQKPYHGHGLEQVLSYRKNKLRGILNGINLNCYDPRNDMHLAARYDENNFIEKKPVNKKMLLKLLNLKPADESTPVISMVTRLVVHKGMDLIKQILSEIMKEDIRLVVLGTGDWEYEQMFITEAQRYPDKLSANMLFCESLSNKIYAGSDIFLMPSQSEPCGISQLAALEYGAIPIVRETGGLKDTIRPYNKFTGEGNGFSFTEYNANDMLYVIREAIALYQDKDTWHKLIYSAMTGDYSWKHSAKEYIEVYQSLVLE